MTFHEGCASEAIYSRKTRANGICASSEKRLVEDYSRRAAREWSSSLGRYTTTALEARIAELEHENEWLLEMLVMLAQSVDLNAAHLAALDGRMPSPRFEIPKGWIVVKEAAARSGYSAPTVYRLVRKGRIVGAPLGGRVYIDPSSLPKPVAAQVEGG
jgi:hypothetical protein